MAIIRPFAALKPANDFVAEVASKPYDVLNTEEARNEVVDNPNSFLHITRAEIDLSPSVDVHSKLVYEQARKNLEDFIGDGVLVKEDKSCYYIYQLIMDGRSQTGLVCLSSVADYFDDVIKKHEFTRPEKEKDRIDHMIAIGAQTGNVFLAYNNVTELDQIINSWKSSHAPTYQFTAIDKVDHTIWTIDKDDVIETITQLFNNKVPATYIADGHHRAASAAKVSQAFPDNDAAALFLTTIFPASELAIMDYNRVVKDLNGLSDEEFLKALETDFTVQRISSPCKPAALHEFGMYFAGAWYVLHSKDGSFQTDPIGILDVTILSNNILDKILGIRDQRTDTRIDFVGGIRGLEELERRVDSNEMKVAFSLYAVTIQQLFDIADSGKVMPPKSTWFEPKLRDGLLTHIFAN